MTSGSTAGTAYSGCFGEECWLIGRKNKAVRGWVACGHLDDRFETIREKIEDIVTNDPELIEQQPCFGITCCLTEASLHFRKPAVVFHCADERFRKKASKLVQRAEFWKLFIDENPDFRLIEQPRAPQLVAAMQPRAKTRNYTLNFNHENAWPPRLIFDDGNQKVSATMGGLLSIRGKLYSMTAGHMLFGFDSSLSSGLPNLDYSDNMGDSANEISRSPSNSSVSSGCDDNLIEIDIDNEVMTDVHHEGMNFPPY